MHKQNGFVANGAASASACEGCVYFSHRLIVDCLSLFLYFYDEQSGPRRTCLLRILRRWLSRDDYDRSRSYCRRR